MKISRHLAFAALLAATLTFGTAYAAEPGFYVGAIGGETTVDKDAYDFGSRFAVVFPWQGTPQYNRLGGISGGHIANRAIAPFRQSLWHQFADRIRYEQLRH